MSDAPPVPCPVCKGKKIMVRIQPVPRRFCFCPSCFPDKHKPVDSEPYGIFDRRDNCWIGDEGGPMLYDDYELAAYGAILIGARMAYELFRLGAKLYTTEAKEKKDVIRPLITLREALTNMQDSRK